MKVRPTQLGLPFKLKGDTFASAAGAEHPVGGEQLMELVVERDNLLVALKRVEQNKGAAGVDGMSVVQLRAHLKEHWPSIKRELLSGEYVPRESVPMHRYEGDEGLCHGLLLLAPDIHHL